MSTILGNPITLGGGGAKLNIDFGTTPPSDTSKLWVPLASKPKAVQADTVMQYGDNIHEDITCTYDEFGPSYLKVKGYEIKNYANTSGSNSYFQHGQYIYCNSAKGKYICRYNMANNHVEYIGEGKYTYNRNSAMAVYGDTIYMNCGVISDTWSGSGSTYNLTTGTAADFNTIKRANHGHSYSVIVGSKMYQFGGMYSATDSTGYSTQVYIYDFTTGVVSYGNPLSYYLYDAAPVAVGTTVYLFGGKYNDGVHSYNQILKYDTLTDTITVLDATLPTKNTNISACLCGGNIYMLLSTYTNNTDNYQYYKTLAIFNTETETLQVVGEVTTNGYHCCNACGLYGESIYFIASGANSTNVLKLTPKTHLGENILFIQESFIPDNNVALIKNKDCEIMANVESVWLGNSEGYADRVNAYIYNDATAQWTLVDGQSVVSDMAAALATLGVT